MNFEAMILARQIDDDGESGGVRFEDDDGDKLDGPRCEDCGGSCGYHSIGCKR